MAAPHELPALLARIYLIEMESDDPANALPSTDKAVSDNDDMMILVVDDHPINRRLLADQLDRWAINVKPRMMASMRLMYLARIILISCLATSTCQIWMVTA
ncbi:two-component system sensor kinase [Escherichia coli]|nr:two-component system sensor kinase [Escherichia coli]